MNRYTFKAKRKDNCEWVYGFLIRKRDLTFNNEYDEFYAIQDDFFEEYRIDEQTLSQCTGLQDIDGKDIFENDIVEINDKFDGIFQTNVVFKNGCFGINMSIVKQIKNPNGWDKIYDKCESLGMNTSKYKTLTKANDDMISGYGYHTDNCKIIGNKFGKEVE